jgi:hypothetical protein
MNRRRFLATCGGAAAAAALGGCRDHRGETLYNGIVLPARWPPRLALSSVPQTPDTPPYLLDPPPVIRVDVGRQLFVDDFLIDDTTLTRVFHRPEYYDGNPVLRPDRPWEQIDKRAALEHYAPSPTAMVFSDGVWWDPAAGAFRMWYMAGYTASTCCAASVDGVSWTKPSLDVVPGTNIVMNETRDSATIWRDPFDEDASRRYKMAEFRGNRGAPLRLFVSPDGIHWTLRGLSGPTDDRSTVFYNPFRKRWIYSLRDNFRLQNGRYRKYWEAVRFVEDARWRSGEPVPWTAADRLDAPREGVHEVAELYSLDSVAYESVLVGLFAIWRGDPHDRPKLNEMFVGFSRDGFHWSRLYREPFFPLSEQEGAWNFGNMQAAGGCFVIKDERLLFYVSGRAGIRGTSLSGPSSTGLATLRRDGFASMRSDGAAPGVLTTRPVQFAGRSLFVNAAAGQGELRVEILDRSGRSIDAFSRDATVPISSDGTKLPVRWRTTDDLSPLRGQPVRLRFHVTAGALFSFWISASPAGKSGGYLAAGGPDYAGIADV